MPWREEFRKILISAFESRKRKNTMYSIRAFSKKVGVASGPLSELMREDFPRKWKLSPKRAAQIVELLELTPAERARILLKIGLPPQEIKPDGVSSTPLPASSPTFTGISIFEKEVSFVGDPQWVQFLKEEIERLLQIAPLLLEKSDSPEVPAKAFKLSVLLQEYDLPAMGTVHE